MTTFSSSRGHGLSAQVSATLGSRAEFAAHTTFPTITADELPPPPPEIIRIHSSGLIIDLRTGLCVDVGEAERLEFALALRFGSNRAVFDAFAYCSSRLVPGATHRATSGR